MFGIKKHKRKRNRSRGQSIVELALLFPVLLILLSGLIEFGLMLNVYLALMDSARNAARFASDGLYYQWDALNDMAQCGETTHFYRQTACLVNQELSMEAPVIEMIDPDNPNAPDPPPPGYVDPVPANNYMDMSNGNDIVISAFSFTQGVGITARHPDADGWSYAIDQGFSPGQVSAYTTAEVSNSMVNINAPSTGYVLVEIYYNYPQRMKLPWLTPFVSDPLLLHAYAFMPLPSAEPTPTPIP